MSIILPYLSAENMTAFNTKDPRDIGFYWRLSALIPLCAPAPPHQAI